MHILTRWSVRTMREDHMRTCTIILAVVGFFALWTSADFIVLSTVSKARITESPLGINAPSFVSFLHDAGFFKGLCMWLGSIAEEMFSGRLLTNSMFRAMTNYLYYGLLMVMIIVLYSIFSVTADECLQDYHILTSVGATVRQIRFRLLQRAIALTLVSAAVGTAAGLLAARVFLADANDFNDTLPLFFKDLRTQLMLLSGLLFAPLTMMLATRFAFRRRQQNKPPRAPKRGMLRRRSFAQRLFGAGGIVGGMSSRKNIRYRIIFTASFAACLALLAQLSNMMAVFKNVEPLLPDDVVDLRVECRSDLPTDDMDELLRQNAQRFGIESCEIFSEPLCAPSEPSVWTKRSYVLLDRAWTDPYYNAHKSPIERDGRSAGLWRSFFGFAFLDDASFDRLAEKNGLEAGTDGAILYNIRYFDDQKRIAPLTALPDREVTFFFLPKSVDIQDCADMPDKDFLREAEPASEKKTIRILKLLPDPPFDLQFNDPTLLFPERMYPSFAQLLSDDSAASAMKKTYYLNLSNPGRGIRAFKQAVDLDPRFNSKNIIFGVEEQNAEHTEENGAMPTYVYDLHSQQYQLEQFQLMIPKFFVILLATAAWILFVGVLNTAHMNRLTRRRPNAILESLGMGRREKTGMLLYESARYALNSIVLGRIFFLALFFPLWGDFQDLLWGNALLAQSERITFRTLILFGTSADRIRFLTDFFDACRRTMPIFAVGAVLIFGLLVLTDWAIGRRYRREELIQILKDDSNMIN